MSTGYFTYRDLMNGWRRYYAFFPATVVIVMLVTFIVLRCMTPHYTASMVVAPASAKTQLRAAQEDKTKHLSVAVRDDDEATETPSDFARFIQIITAPDTVIVLLQDKKLALADHMPQPGRLKKAMLSLAGQAVEDTHDPLYIARKLGQMVRIDAIGRSTMRRVSIRHPDRNFAVALLGALYAEADRSLRLQALEQVDQEMAALRQGLAQVEYTDQRQSLNAVLSAKEQNALLLQNDVPYAAQMVQLPQVPQQPDWPNVPVTIMLMGVLSVFLGWLVVYGLSVRLWQKTSRSV